MPSLERDLVASKSNLRTLGVGLGVGLGVPLILALSGIVFLIRPSRQTKNDIPRDTRNEAEDIANEPRKEFQCHEASDQHEILEASSRVEIYEAPESNAVS